EGELLLGHRHRTPAQLADRAVVLAEARRRLPDGKRRLAELLCVLHRGADAVEPGALVGAARRGEGRPGELLGIEPIGCALRRVLADGERARQRLRLEIVAEARHISGRRRLRPLRAAAVHYLAA